MKERLLSLSCSGESIEKVLTLYYHALLSSPDFYKRYNVILFFGNNLPKKDKCLCSHGTLAFYNKYFFDCSAVPPCNKEFYIRNANVIINYLLEQGVFTRRQTVNLKKDDETFWNAIKFLPFSYLYPNFIGTVIAQCQKKLGIYKIQPLYLEQKYINQILKITENRACYSIYGLSPYGRVSRYYLDYENANEQAHLITELGKQNVLSGNSAMLINSINTRIGSKTIVGYRKRTNNVRRNREIALEVLLEGHKSIQEPKNTEFNSYFGNMNDVLSMEERANLAFARGYQRFIDECLIDLKISTFQDEIVVRSNLR